MNPKRIRVRFTILAHVYFSSVRYPKNKKKSNRLRVDVTIFSPKVSRANRLPRGVKKSRTEILDESNYEKTCYPPDSNCSTWRALFSEAARKVESAIT